MKNHSFPKPFIQMQSDITDVVYLNWLVPTVEAQKHLPPNIKLIDKNGFTLFSILTYKHHNFGPKFIGRLRKLFGSPLQSNWRFYIEEINEEVVKEPTIYFTQNFLNNRLYTIGANIFTNILKADYARNFHFVKNTTLSLQILTSKDFILEAERSTDYEIPKNFQSFFGTQQQILDTIIEQEYACLDFGNNHAISQIKLRYNVVEPLSVINFESNYLSTLVGNNKPFSFVIPKLHFEVKSEKMIDNNFTSHKGVYTFTYTTLINENMENVWTFFSRPKNIEKVSEEQLSIDVNIPQSIKVKKDLEFLVNMKLFGFLPQSIGTRVVKVEEPTFFSDKQISGSFKSWLHEHQFEKQTDYTTKMTDTITFELPFEPIGRIFYHLVLKKMLRKSFKHREVKLKEIFGED